MTISPSASIQRAREELAGHLREIRLDARLTARALSAAAGWHEAKTSRIESAKQAPSDADIRMWCQVCNANDRVADLVAASRAADSMYVEWRRVLRSGLRRTQESARPLYERTRVFKVYCSNVVPAFIQTADYAHALLSAIASFRNTPDDVAEAVQARISRNQILHSNVHRFMLLIEECVLGYQFGDSRTMDTQLRHMLRAMTLPSVSLGVIPGSSPGRHIWAQETFAIFDDARVHVDLLSAQVTITTPSETALYVRGFSELSGLAVYGEQARALITTAIDAVKE